MQGEKALTETTQTIPTFSTTELKQWLENETNSILTPVQTQAKKLRDEMNTSLVSLDDVCKSLLDNSTKEIEKLNTSAKKSSNTTSF